MNQPADQLQFRAHLQEAGGISRANPELKRLADATGFSLDHLFKVATGQRHATRRCAIAVTVAAGKPLAFGDKG